MEKFCIIWLICHTFFFASSQNCLVVASVSFQLIRCLPLCVLPTDFAGIPFGCFPGLKRSNTTVVYSQQLSAVCNKRATIQVSNFFLIFFFLSA